MDDVNYRPSDPVSFAELVYNSKTKDDLGIRDYNKSPAEECAEQNKRQIESDQRALIKLLEENPIFVG